MQRLLARFGYIRLADHGLEMTRYGVVRSPQQWPHEPSSLPYGAPSAEQAHDALPFSEQVPASWQQQAAQSLIPITLPEGAGYHAADVLAVEAADECTTVAQPLSEYHFPLSPPDGLSVDLNARGASSNKWGNPQGHATQIGKAEHFVSQRLGVDDDKTLFSEPPVHSERVATPPP